jgi:EAL domain-containing protein (putative c-di-GMP-specific phosphodiesterase class I)
MSNVDYDAGRSEVPPGSGLMTAATADSVNLSPVQFQHDDLPAMVHAVLLETDLAADRLDLEITEGVLIGDFTRAPSILRRLKGP